MEILYICPCCKRSGFSLFGLKVHRCSAKPKRRETPTGPLIHQRITQKEIDQAKPYELWNNT